MLCSTDSSTAIPALERPAASSRSTSSSRSVNDSTSAATCSLSWRCPMPAPRNVAASSTLKPRSAARISESWRRARSRGRGSGA
jgi:hypothetical protein